MLSIETDDEAHERHSVDTPDGISLSSVVDLLRDDCESIPGVIDVHRHFEYKSSYRKSNKPY